MRIVTVALGLFAALAFTVAALLAVNTRAFLREAATAPGVVTRLNDGSLQVDVTVRPADGPPFV